MHTHDQLDRVLDSLLHDLRSPLGAASGYLRLLREGRIAPGADTEQALTAAQGAVQTMARLCADADRWLHEHPRTDAAPVPGTTLVRQVLAELERRQMTLAGSEQLHEVPVRVCGSLDVLSVAVSDVLSTVARSRPTSGAPSVRSSDGVLRFYAGTTATAGGASVGPFDPWTYPGLTVPLAYRHIVAAGGRCEAFQNSAGIQITFEEWRG